MTNRFPVLAHWIGEGALIVLAAAATALVSMGDAERLSADTVVPDGPRLEREPALELARAGFFDASTYAPRRAGFGLRVGDFRVSHQVLAVTALPGQGLSLRVEGARGATEFVLRFAEGEARSTSPDAWDWLAPTAPGLYALRVESGDGDFIHLNVLVMHGRDRVRSGTLNGYAIGTYRAQPLRGDPAYLPPIGFVEATPANEDVLVSPHFTLGQFLCKQPGEPKYLALSVPLVQKLEAVLAQVNAAGVPAPSLHVMSGFRTPAYNAAIGNTTVYSRHLWGDAADIYVDLDGDRQMDDLNGDGRSDVGDARVLYEMVDALERKGRESIRNGGLALYRRNAAHGPFVHVDARGNRARW